MRLRKRQSFDLLGAAKAIDALKELILSLWDRVIFYRERKVEVRLELVAKAMPILEDLGNLRDEGKLEAEEVELVRRGLISGLRSS